jgi:hypothetical protein
MREKHLKKQTETEEFIRDEIIGVAATIQRIGQGKAAFMNNLATLALRREQNQGH